MMFNSLNLKNIGFFHTNNGIYYNSQNYYNIYIKRHVLFILILKNTQNIVCKKMEDCMENSTRAKTSFSRIGFGYLLPYFGYLLIMLICTVVIAKIFGAGSMTGNGYMILNYVIRVGLLYPAMYLFVRSIPSFEIKKNKLGVGGFIACIFITYAIMFCCNGVGLVLNNAIGKLTGQGSVNPLVDAIDAMSPVVQVVLVVILAPICEELLFRKFIIDRIVNYGEVPAMLISGLMFGLYHGNLAQFMYAAGIGIFFAFIYIRTGKIGYTIALHMFVNGFSTLLTLIMFNGLSVSEFMNVYMSGDAEAYQAYLEQHMEVFAVMGLVGIFVFLMVIVGVILMIVLHKKFVFEHHAEEVEKGKRFGVSVLNPGMLLYILFWVIIIITTQFGISLFDNLISLFM